MPWSRQDGLAGDGSPASDDRPLPAPPGPRVLVVEDNAQLGLDLEDTLRDAGFEVVGPVQSLDRAVSQAGEDGFDVAVLNIGLGDGRTFPVADVLAERGIPFVFLSGYDRTIVPDEHAERPFLQKPCSSRTIVAALRLASV